jgi:hypothetical protein
VLRMEGAEPNQTNVSLTAFLEELEALRKALKETEEIVAGRPVLEWEVVDLSHSSPATVSIEPIFEQPVNAPETRDRREAVVGRFFSYLRALNSDVAPAELDTAALEAFQRLAAPVRQKRIRATISNGTEPMIEVREAVERTIVAVLAPTMKADGSVKGRLEFLNIHAESNVFRIYSPLISRYVTCHFPVATILARAKEAMGRKVRVEGQLTYHTRDPYPRSIEVRAIEVLAEDSELPELLNLRGIAPGATGDLLSEDYVRELRSEQ